MSFRYHIFSGLYFSVFYCENFSFRRSFLKTVIYLRSSYKKLYIRQSFYKIFLTSGVKFRHDIVQQKNRLLTGLCLYQIQLCQFQRQGRSPLLTLRPKTSYVNIVYIEGYIVPMRPSRSGSKTLSLAGIFLSNYRASFSRLFTILILGSYSIFSFSFPSVIFP